MHFGVAQPPT